MSKKLITRTDIRVRFSEVDSMGVVWHGNYIKYFEEGREDFGIKHGISYLDFSRDGVLVPIVKIECDYKRSLIYGDTATIETRFVNSNAAKIVFEYTIFRNSASEIVATGKTVQVFVNEAKELLFDLPEFFSEWKRKNDLYS